MAAKILDKPFVQKVIALLLTTICVTAVMMITASDPSADDMTRGGAAGLVGYFASRLFCPDLRKIKRDE